MSGKLIIFDPFIRGNELASSVNFSLLKADYILVSHGHEDHTADLVDLAKQTEATVVANWEIHAWLQKQGITKTHPMNIGGKWTFDFGTVQMIFAAHSSSLPDGTYGGTAAGFVLSNEANNETIYYAGDTALCNDMSYVGEQYRINIAVLPIGDNFTMGYVDANRAADLVGCEKVVAMHFDTFGFIKVDHEKAINYFENHEKTLIIPAIGSTITI
jgi:L-ascorbate metabolism protein UlaG (beta-lactamase superfamily)